MTEAEKSFVEVVAGVIDEREWTYDPNHAADQIRIAVNAAGLQITERPHRQALPDAPGWWFVRTGEGPWRVIEVELRDGALVRVIRRELPTIGQRVGSLKCDAAFGPLEVPE